LEKLNQQQHLTAGNMPKKVPGLRLPFFQPKLSVNAPDDVFEREADAMADKVMRKENDQAENTFFFKPMSAAPSVQLKYTSSREKEYPQKKEDEEKKKENIPEQTAVVADAPLQRKCSHCEEDEMELHRKESDAGSGMVTQNVEQSLQSAGHQMDGNTRDFMESRFGYDFSNVQIHTDSQAHQSSAEINALAYTHQNHIVFGAGQYQPATDEGKKLLAHELTHVVQQSGGIDKKPIQRKPFFFAPVNKPSGTLVHSQVLPLFVKANSDLFIEVKIPGANKKDVDKGVTGIADFYKSSPTGGSSRSIGINFDGNDPSYLGSSGKLQFGGGAYNHEMKAAPKGQSITPKVTRLADAPTQIQIGDLKPGFSSESFLGQGQVDDYKSGIKNTSTDINKYIAANPTEADSKTSWNPSPQSMSSLNIPAEVKYPSGKGFPIQPLALYEEGLLKPKVVLDDTGLKGRLFVYQDTVSGVWSYEWIPDSIPASTGSGLVNTVLNRLNGQVIPALTAAGSGAITPKRAGTKEAAPIRKKPGKFIQKAEKKFSDEDWKKKQFTPWQDDAKKFLGNKDEVNKAQVANALVGVEQRAGTAIGIPSEVKDRGTGLDKVKHWNRFGGLYGWLREKFDFVYVKLQAFGKKVKEKIAKLSKSSAAVKFGNWVKAAAQVIFKIFKMVGGWVVNQVVDKLINSFRQGAINNLKKLVDMYTPDDVKSKIEEFEAMKEKYEQIINEQEDALIKKFFGDKLDLFEKLSEFEDIASTLSTIISLVEWGIRLLACASPPAVGCLWNLFIEALQVAFALLMQTCWFTKEVYKPVIDLVAPVKNFPAEVASKIVDVANGYIPMPDGFDPIFAPIAVDTGDFKVDCDEKDDGAGKLTPERKAIMDLMQTLGKEKFDALIQLMLKRGAGPWVLLTPDRAEMIKDKLKNISAETLLDVANNPKKDVPEDLKAFLGDIAKYSETEKKTIKKYFDDKAGADAEKAKKEEAAKAASVSQTPGSQGSVPQNQTGGGTSAGTDSKVIVLDGRDYGVKDQNAQPTRPGFVKCYIYAADWPAIKAGKNPGTISLDIYVDNALTYRVQHVIVSSVQLQEILAVPENMHSVLVYLQYGVQLKIRDEDVIIKSFDWSRD
jgi:hypothetical protein